jgi:hypothetical protein
MLSLLKRKPKLAAQIEHQPLELHQDPRRKKQQNIKVTEDFLDRFCGTRRCAGPMQGRALRRHGGGAP